MGYSIFVKVKDKKQADAMIRRIPKEKRNGDSYWLHRDITYTGNIKGDLVGFGFQSSISDSERNYIYGIIKWFAGLLNKRYYYYDGQKFDFVRNK